VTVKCYLDTSSVRAVLVGIFSFLTLKTFKLVWPHLLNLVARWNTMKKQKSIAKAGCVTACGWLGMSYSSRWPLKPQFRYLYLPNPQNLLKTRFWASLLFRRRQVNQIGDKKCLKMSQTCNLKDLSLYRGATATNFFWSNMFPKSQTFSPQNLSATLSPRDKWGPNRIWTVIAVCYDVFRLAIFCCLLETVAIMLRNHLNSDAFGEAKYFGEELPNFWPDFINLDHRRVWDKVCDETDRPRRLGAERQRDVEVLMLRYQVESNSPGGATSNSKMSKPARYRHVHHTLALMCKKIV